MGYMGNFWVLHVLATTLDVHMDCRSYVGFAVLSTFDCRRQASFTSLIISFGISPCIRASICLRVHYTLSSTVFLSSQIMLRVLF